MYLKNFCLQISDGCRNKNLSERCMGQKNLTLTIYLQYYIPLILMNEISIISQKRRIKKIKKINKKKKMPPLLTRLAYAIEYLIEIPQEFTFLAFLFKIDSMRVKTTIL